MPASTHLSHFGDLCAAAMLQTSTRIRQTCVGLTAVCLISVAGAATTATAQDLPDTMLPLRVDSVQLTDDGGLVAIGSLGGESFVSPVDLSLLEIIDGGPGQGQAKGKGKAKGHDKGKAKGHAKGHSMATCAILDLELGAIHLDLLGLQVDTSDICLEVAAERGNLLGELLCAVAGLLDDGLSLEDALGELTDAELADLLDGLADLLNGALAQATSPHSFVGVSDSELGECDILNLAVGPIDLNLLGLTVYLHDCDDGPVTVDITAESGDNNLLGNLLCALADLLDLDPFDELGLLAGLLGQIADAILDLLELLELAS